MTTLRITNPAEKKTSGETETGNGTETETETEEEIKTEIETEEETRTEIGETERGIETETERTEDEINTEMREIETRGRARNFHHSLTLTNRQRNHRRNNPEGSATKIRSGSLILG